MQKMHLRASLLGGPATRSPAPLCAAGSPLFVLSLACLIDSEQEETITSWRAAGSLWPDLTAATCELEGTPRLLGARKAWSGGSWDGLQGTGAGGLPRWLGAKLRQLRPVVGSSLDSVLLLRLCAEEALAAGPGKRPLTVGEMSTNWGPDLREALVARYSSSEAEVSSAFASAREAWLAEDSAGWRAAHRWHEGAIAPLRRALRRASEEGGHGVRVLSAMPPRTTEELLSHAQLGGGIECCEAAAAEATLVTLRQRWPDADMVYIDDRAEAVRAAAADVRLLSLRLAYAEWGSASPSQAALAASFPRVRRLVNPSDLAAVLE